jgi:hypothetical protein
MKSYSNNHIYFFGFPNGAKYMLAYLRYCGERFVKDFNELFYFDVPNAN